MRTSEETGTRSSPNGYPSRRSALPLNGACATASSSTPNAARSRARWSSRSSARGSRSAASQTTGSEAALMRVPVLLEVPHECGAQVAVGLLAAERRHVLPEDVERLRPDAQRAPVPGRIHEARAGERLDALRYGRVERGGRLDDLVAEQVAVRRAGLELQAGEDRLPSEPVTDRAGEPEVGRAGEDPLFARGKVEASSARRDHVVDRVQDLAGAPDRERLDRGDPQLLGRLLRLVGKVLLAAQPAKQLVHVSEVARDEEEVVDAAVIEVREVETRAEDAPAGVARVA